MRLPRGLRLLAMTNTYVIANEVKQSYINVIRLPRRFAPRNDIIAALSAAPRNNKKDDDGHRQ